MEEVDLVKGVFVAGDQVQIILVQVSLMMCVKSWVN